jgi:hypothetical protein
VLRRLPGWSGGSRLQGGTDLLYVREVRSAASTEDVQVGEPGLQTDVVFGELVGIAFVEVVRQAQDGVFCLGRVGAEPVNTSDPVLVLERWAEVDRMRTVDHVVRRCSEGSPVQRTNNPIPAGTVCPVVTPRRLLNIPVGKARDFRSGERKLGDAGKC